MIKIKEPNKEQELIKSESLIDMKHAIKYHFTCKDNADELQEKTKQVKS